MSEALNVLETLVGCASFSLNTLSITDISVDVELMPTNALQSFTTHPAAKTSLPRFTVPAYYKIVFFLHCFFSKCYVRNTYNQWYL